MKQKTGKRFFKFLITAWLMLEFTSVAWAASLNSVSTSLSSASVSLSDKLKVNVCLNINGAVVDFSQSGLHVFTIATSVNGKQIGSFTRTLDQLNCNNQNLGATYQEVNVFTDNGFKN